MTTLRQAVMHGMQKQMKRRLSERYSYVESSLPTAYVNMISEMGVHYVFLALQELKLVTLKREPDDWVSYDDLMGDSYDPEANPDIDPNVLKKQEEAFRQRIDVEGVYVYSSAYLLPDGTTEDSDTIGGFVGNDFFGSGYEPQVMLAALDEVARVFGVPEYDACTPSITDAAEVFLTTLQFAGLEVSNEVIAGARWGDCWPEKGEPLPVDVVMEY